MNYKLENLIDANSFQQLLTGLNETRPLTLAILDNDGKVLASTAWQDVRSRFDSEQTNSAGKAKSSFIANMGHELRTPMNGIIGFSDLLSSSGLNQQQSIFNTMLKSSASRLLELINQILDYSMLEVGKLELRKIPFDIRDAAAACVCMVQNDLTVKNLQLQLEIDPAINFDVKGDPLRFKQVLLNLLTNAIKFTSNGKVSVSLKQLSHNDTISNISLTVSDEGIGMVPERAGEIFEVFHQLDNTSTRRYYGAGVGLSMVKGIVELMNGKISVESEVDKGSVFSVEIPFEIKPDFSKCFEESRACVLNRD